MTTRTYGQWHDLAEAVPARGMFHDIEVEFEDGTTEIRYCGPLTTFDPKLTRGIPDPGNWVVRWRVAREHKPDANGWWLLSECKPEKGQLVLLHGRGTIVTRWDDLTEHLRGPHSNDPNVIIVSWTHWKPVELPGEVTV